MKTFPSPEVLRRFPFGLADIGVILGTLVLLALVARVGAGALVSFEPPDIVPAIDLDPQNLPYYAGRSTLRMFIALFFSTVFTLVYGYIAANSRRAERELKRFMDWTDRPWSAIAPRHIAQFKAYLLELGLAQASVNRALCAIKSFFAWLYKAYPDSVSTKKSKENSTTIAQCFYRSVTIAVGSAWAIKGCTMPSRS
jgi:ABC-type nitrate/sulfonate/bicarbonate transport system permease component